MAHELEMVNGEASMAYAGDTPWHGLGVKVLPDLTPEQMLKAANLDWTVEKSPAYALINGEPELIGRSALVRDRDHSILDIVTDDWNPVQNAEAFDFFHEFVMAGDMEMHTAGSLKGGQIVWALARSKNLSNSLRVMLLILTFCLLTFTSMVSRLTLGLLRSVWSVITLLHCRLVLRPNEQ